jgi:heme-degrading monooxygenase HmoA
MIVTVLRSRLAPGVQDEYGSMAREMSELARSIPGYISHKGFVAEDGERVTIVEFESEEALHEWKVHPRHREAKRLGFAKFYSTFGYQICNVIHARSWDSKAGKP